MVRQKAHPTRRYAFGLAAAATAAVAISTTASASASTHAHPLDWTSGERGLELTSPGSDELGFSVAISGNGKVAVMGSAGDKAFVFTKMGTGWKRAAELAASDGDDGDGFGSTVAVSRDGSNILVGAVQHDDRTGAAYVFTRTGHGWTETAALKAPDPVEFGGFGWSVSLSADGATALVGANGQGVAGEAYVFRRSGTTWTRTAALSPSDGKAGDAFGDAVALSAGGSTAVVGAPLHTRSNTSRGAAYVFSASGGVWAQTAEPAPADGAPDHMFGVSVAVSRTGSVVVVGATAYRDTTGAAYVFIGSAGAYTEADKLTSSDGSGLDSFGESLAVSGSGSVIAVSDKLQHYQAGVEYVFTRRAGDWSQKAELYCTRRRERNWFGQSTGLSSDGSTLLVGAMARDGNAGSAFVFTR